MKDKKDSSRLILYQKYRHDNDQNYQDEKNNLRKEYKSFGVQVREAILTLILTAMIFLSAVGLVTLIDPQLKHLLIEVLRIRFRF